MDCLEKLFTGFGSNYSLGFIHLTKELEGRRKREKTFKMISYWGHPHPINSIFRHG
jgi:hypothetical protein